jgi:hypothetical protein
MTDSLFDLVRARPEGSPMHPDDMLSFPKGATEAQIETWCAKQLKAYNDYWSEHAAEEG